MDQDRTQTNPDQGETPGHATHATAAGLSDQPHSRAPAEDRDRPGENKRKTSPENDQAAGSDQQPKKDAANQPRKPPFYKRPLLMLFLGLGLLVAIVVAVVWWLYARQYESTDDAFIDGHVVTISPNVSATVWAVHVDDNSRVKKGDLLVELDGRDYQVVVEQTKAGLTAAQERVHEARAQLDVANANVAESQAQLVVAQTNADNSQRDYQRIASLDERSRSQQQLDDVTAATKSAAAQVAQAKARLAATQAGVSSAEVSIKTAQAAAAGAQADLDQAQINLDYCRITAPSDGLVTRKNVEPGEYVQKGQPLFAVVPTDVWVTANFKETQLDRLRPGQDVTIEVDAYGSRDFRGKVDSIQNGSGSKFSLLPAENATGNYVKVVQRIPVKIVFVPGEIDHIDFLLAPGMSVVPSVKVR